ncbi:MAG: hypothetical protein IPG25_11930 [Proteobacteria bacterium]|nr:hypothetical protein [Pseudomonadota bacterium]
MNPARRRGKLFNIAANLRIVYLDGISHSREVELLEACAKVVGLARSWLSTVCIPPENAEPDDHFEVVGAAEDMASLEVIERFQELEPQFRAAPPNAKRPAAPNLKSLLQPFRGLSNTQFCALCGLLDAENDNFAGASYALQVVSEPFDKRQRGLQKGPESRKATAKLKPLVVQLYDEECSAGLNGKPKRGFLKRIETEVREKSRGEPERVDGDNLGQQIRNICGARRKELKESASAKNKGPIGN